jgi:hypothetical protein
MNSSSIPNFESLALETTRPSTVEMELQSLANLDENDANQREHHGKLFLDRSMNWTEVYTSTEEADEYGDYKLNFHRSLPGRADKRGGSSTHLFRMRQRALGKSQTNVHCASEAILYASDSSLGSASNEQGIVLYKTASRASVTMSLRRESTARSSP